MTTSRDPFLSVIILWWLKYLAGNRFRWMWKENNWLKWSVSVRRPHGTYFHYFCNHLVNFWPRIKKKTPKSTFSLSMINRQSLSSESFSVATGSLCAIFKVKTLWAVIKVHHLIFYAFWCSLNSNPWVSWWYLMTKKSEFISCPSVADFSTDMKYAGVLLVNVNYRENNSFEFVFFLSSPFHSMLN